MLLPFALSLIISACGSSGPSSGGSSGPVTLNILHEWSKTDPVGKVFQDILTQFHNANPTITVKQTINSEDAAKVYDTSYIAGSEADIVMTNLIGPSLQWVKKGAVVPASDYLQQWGLQDRILPEALQEWKDDSGRIQGFPYDGFKWPVWYNMGLLKKAGINDVPKTTDQLIAAAQKLRATGNGPLVVGGNDWSGNKLFFQVMESYLSDQEAKTLLTNGNFCDNANAQKGVQLFVKLRDAGVFVDSTAGLSADNMNALFYSSKAAIMPAGSWAFNAAPSTLTANDNVFLSGMPIPSDAVHPKPTAFEGYTGTGLWISPNGKKKLDAVHKFIDFMYQPSTIKQFVEKGGLVPAVQDVPLDAGSVNPLLSQATSKLDERVSYVVLPDVYVPSSVQDKLIRATSQAFINGQSVSQICSAIQGAYQ